MPPITTNKLTGLFGRNFFAEDQHGQRGSAECERRIIRLAEMLEKSAHAFPKIAVPAFDSEELGQLRAGKLQARRRP